MSIELEQRLKKIEDKLNSLSSQTRVQWEDQRTDSNIQIVGGPTKILKKGTVITGLLIPTPQGIALSFLVRGDDNSTNIVSVDNCTYI